MEDLPMFRTRLLARLAIPMLAAAAFQTLVAGEPEGATPAATSVRQWKSDSSSAATPAAAPTMARSIREWRSNTSAKIPAAAPCTDPSVMPAAAPAATPAVRAAVSTSPIAISITSMMRHGKLVVMLDGVPVFTEEFQKPILLISQTTTWDPIQVAAGRHRLSAKVLGAKKTYLSAIYDLDVSHTKESELRFLMKGDKLTVEVSS
jgi:hypothetical protein